MKPIAVLLSLAALTLPGAGARADQLQCNSKQNADRALGLLPPKSIVIDFCSMCTDTAKVVVVKSAAVVQDCQFEVEIQGVLVARSASQFNERYQITEQAYRQRVDLAYVYVETAPNQFQWLGGVLGLRAQVKVPILQLPADLYKNLGAHTLPEIKAAPAPRKIKIAALGFGPFAQPGLREAVRAFEQGDLPKAEQAADQALDTLIARVLAGSGLKGLPTGRALRDLIENALRNRLQEPSEPLRGVLVGAELKLIERLPLAKLEQAVAVLAVWAAAKAQAWNQTSSVSQAAEALLSDMATLSDLYRRTPRAAALAQFYAVLYLRAVDMGAEFPENARIVAQRLLAYFVDERGAFQGNYAQVLTQLLKE